MACFNGAIPYPQRPGTLSDRDLELHYFGMAMNMSIKRIRLKFRSLTDLMDERMRRQHNSIENRITTEPEWHLKSALQRKAPLASRFGRA